MKHLALILLVGLVIGAAVSAQTQTPTVTVDLVWEAETTTPDFYLGKTLVGPQARVRAVALVEPARNDLTYRWSKDGRQVKEAVGAGANLLIFAAGAAGDVHRLEVAALDPQSKKLGGDVVNISVQKPKLLLYEDQPTTGTNYRFALPERWGVRRPELTVLAEPYFFSSDDNLEYRWRLNGEPAISNPRRAQQITLVAPPGPVGRNLVELIVNHPKILAQTAQKSLELGGAANQNDFLSFWRGWFKLPLAAAEEGVRLLAPLDESTAPISNINNYLETAFPRFIAIIALLAVVVIAWGGFEYMFSKVPGAKSDGKQRIWYAIWGLLLALTAFLILQTINPKIISSDLERSLRENQ